MAIRCISITFALTLAVLLGCQSAVKPSWPLPTGVTTVPVNGYPMAYHATGTGPTVVLVHGSAQDYRWWEPQHSLATQFRMISVSLRHYYPEPWDGKGSFSGKQHVADLISFITALDSGPVFLVGHSRGGLIAGAAATQRPALVKKLVLMEPAFFLAAKPNVTGEYLTDIRAKEAAAVMEKQGVEAGLAYWFDETFGKGSWAKVVEPNRTRQLDNARTITHPDNLRVTCEELQKLNMPILLVGGAISPAPLRNGLSASQKCLPMTSRVDISKAGHAMNRQNPDEFNAALTRFLLD